MGERAVRTHRFEIVNFAGDHKAAKKRWHEIADKCREVANVIWQAWECWHIQNGSPQKLRDFAEARRNWHEAKKTNPKVKQPKNLKLQCMPSACGKAVYAAATAAFPGVHLRALVLLMNVIKQRMTGKDSEGRWRMWQAVLLGRQGRPSAEHSLPIPFDKRSAEIEQHDKRFSLAINLTRLPREGKAATSIEDRCDLKAKGSGFAILSRIKSGEYDFCGSSIVYHRGKRKWFALIAYRLPKVESKVTGDKTARFWPGRNVPFVFSVGGNITEINDIGQFAAATRASVLGQRWSRKRGYQYGGSSDKGHGRHRALARVDKLSLRWKDGCKTANHQLTRKVVRWCIERGVSTLIYYQPLGEKKETRLISNIGKQGDAGRDQSDWEFAQIATMLAYKCQEAGIKLVIEKVGDGKQPAAA